MQVVTLICFSAFQHNEVLKTTHYIQLLIRASEKYRISLTV